MESGPDVTFDGLLHHLVLSGIFETGRAPDVESLARAAQTDVDSVRRGLERLDAGHGLVLHPGAHEVWLAHPFALVPTAFFVQGAARGHWAACIWCALGIVEATGQPAQIHTWVAGEGVPLVIDVDAGGIRPPGLLAHFPVPVARAWDNVHRFCGSTLVFVAASDVERWCEQYGVERGDVLPLEQVRELARHWYGGHLARDWRKWSVDEARAIFERVGLTHPTWALPDAEGRF